MKQIKNLRNVAVITTANAAPYLPVGVTQLTTAAQAAAMVKSGIAIYPAKPKVQPEKPVEQSSFELLKQEIPVAATDPETLDNSLLQEETETTEPEKVKEVVKEKKVKRTEKVKSKKVTKKKGK